ncbi:ABC transporter ATP-binding protein [Amycolatopsis cihanbeyliensis]|uniref:Putative ABC transport system ATP-binding protein n=1 Tax=Amycolatopsis cihanbeyliensis TaxID=1128664 RepID=A0A542DCB2_AMYCI|nr:ATP-binding cassette domain-containing protein [Amycolatopsis cihanbeyliensis]TQJ00695.1 putative ABC transport system ATP-binding protein [Amycolatopsis cihanbeyliensis]
MHDGERVSAPAGTVFRLRDLGVDYHPPTGTVTALDAITLDVPDRGITVLAGPSGSGKSTLLRVLGLFERPARGTVTFGGTDTGRLGHAARRALRRDRLSQVFQNPLDNLVDYLTVAENLRAAADSVRTRCEPAELLEQLGLDGTGGWRISALSGGQQQRLAFGCALARGSSVILADEPTSQLDDGSAELVLETLRVLAERDHAVVVAAHDDRLIRLGDRIARLRGGTLQEVEDRA